MATHRRSAELLVPASLWRTAVIRQSGPWLPNRNCACSSRPRSEIVARVVRESIGAHETYGARNASGFHSNSERSRSGPPVSR
ncbi:MAG: hypothetical protein OER93_07920, partial [Thermoleophilia bacterium]|nr:hypothetical protein [Thermoleophilia bacterium]